MCRIFGQLSVVPQNPTDYLVHSRCSLLAQSNAKRDFRQEDGWGVANLKNGRFEIIKSPNPIYKEKKKFEQTASGATSRIVIAHIRAASNPLKLPKKQLIAKEHNQPFGKDSLAFAHNGTLNIAAAARERLLGPYQKNIKGRNDSEIYFWILYKWYAKTRDIPQAMIRTAREIWQLWRTLGPQERKGWKFPYTGLNAAVSDGKRLYALCHSLQPAASRALCLRDQPYNRLALRLTDGGTRFIVGSEKLSQEPGWKVAPMHSLMTAWQSDGKIRYKMEQFPWKA